MAPHPDDSRPPTLTCDRRATQRDDGSIPIQSTRCLNAFSPGDSSTTGGRGGGRHVLLTSRAGRFGANELVNVAFIATATRPIHSAKSPARVGQHLAICDIDAGCTPAIRPRGLLVQAKIRRLSEIVRHAWRRGSTPRRGGFTNRSPASPPRWARFCGASTFTARSLSRNDPSLGAHVIEPPPRRRGDSDGTQSRRGELPAVCATATLGAIGE